MSTKPLYLLVSDGGDGSYSVQFTFDSELIALLDQAHDAELLDYDDVGCDGDGFHYTTLHVPVECTAQSLGIRYLLSDEKKEEVRALLAERGEEEED